MADSETFEILVVLLRLLLDAGRVEILGAQHVAIFAARSPALRLGGAGAALARIDAAILDRRRRRRQLLLDDPLGRSLGIGPGIGRLEIDDVAEQDLSFIELVAPDDDGLEGQG